jgi:hypothetical protein
MPPANPVKSLAISNKHSFGVSVFAMPGRSVRGRIRAFGSLMPLDAVEAIVRTERG